MKFVDEQGEGASATLSALRAYREHRAAGRRGLPPEAPLDFAPAALQPLIRHNGVTDRRRWESALFLKVRDVPWNCRMPPTAVFVVSPKRPSRAAEARGDYLAVRGPLPLLGMWVARR